MRLIVDFPEKNSHYEISNAEIFSKYEISNRIQGLCKVHFNTAYMYQVLKLIEYGQVLIKIKSWRERKLKFNGESTLCKLFKNNNINFEGVSHD